MDRLLTNYDDDELTYLIKVFDDKMSEHDEKYHLLKDFKDEILTYLSNNKEG